MTITKAAAAAIIIIILVTAVAVVAAAAAEKFKLDALISGQLNSFHYSCMEKMSLCVQVASLEVNAIYSFLNVGYYTVTWQIRW
jgi:hypothetical protein